MVSLSTFRQQNKATPGQPYQRAKATNHNWALNESVFRGKMSHIPIARRMSSPIEDSEAELSDPAQFTMQTVAHSCLNPAGAG